MESFSRTAVSTGPLPRRVHVYSRVVSADGASHYCAHQGDIVVLNIFNRMHNLITFSGQGFGGSHPLPNRESYYSLDLFGTDPTI